MFSDTSDMRSEMSDMNSDMSLLNMSSCTLCPRKCRADRQHGKTGFCREPAALYASRAALLYYEEPCISPESGSGAVFFNGCSLGCCFCQNHLISTGQDGPVRGVELSSSDLVRVFFDLKEQGAANINLVTPSHYLHVLIPALEKARREGLGIPVVYNTSSYERPQALRLLEGLVDIYIPDMKFESSLLSGKWARAADYFSIAKAAIAEMVRQCPEPVFSDGGHALSDDPDAPPPVMERGVIVRHMVMPGQAEDSKRIIRYLYETYGDSIFISIMNQYTPMPQVDGDPVLSRRVTQKEYDEVVDFAISLGVNNGFIQEGETASDSFIPAFDGTGLTGLT